MNLLVMYDSALNTAFPPGGDAYAAYIDGHIGDQPNYNWTLTAFPAARHLSIAVFPADDADTLDIEAGAATPRDFPAWHARQQARGITRPCAYASAAVMETELLPILTAAAIPRSQVRLWTAHYAAPHICGPGTCGALSTDADATQWTPRALGRTLDQSLVTPGFFTTTPTPPPAWEDTLMASIPEITLGARGQAVRNWQAQLVAHGYGYLIAPAPAPGMSVEERAGIDGDFGAATSAATRKFQGDKGLTVDGITGPQTWTTALTVS